MTAELRREENAVGAANEAVGAAQQAVAPPSIAILGMHAVIATTACVLLMYGTGWSMRGLVLAVAGGGLVLVAYPTALRRRAVSTWGGSPFVGAPILRLLPLIGWAVAVAYAFPLGRAASESQRVAVVVALALFTGLYGAASELDRRHAVDQRHLLEALVEAAQATRRAHTVPSTGAELRHEARAALFGIEAAAQNLSRHKDLLTDDQYADLSRALVAEVGRLRTMLESQPSETSTFDLVAAVLPVVRCRQAAGLRVHVHGPAAVEVEGKASSAAQVVLCLLDNAEKHAPGSPVELAIEVGGSVVLLTVGDRGPGLPTRLGKRIFSPGVRRHGSPGAGLGLAIAQRLMEEQGGAIVAEPRPGGGAQLLLTFDRARTGTWPARRTETTGSDQPEAALEAAT